MISARFLTVAGALAGGSGVLLGAFGAHALRGRIPTEMLATYHTGVEYHLLHALALLGAGMLAQRAPRTPCLRWAGALFLAGIVLFSGSLYALAVTGAGGLGLVTPFGGLALVAGWLLLARGVFTSQV